MSSPAPRSAAAVSVRAARPDEYAAVGDLTVRAYQAAGFLTGDEEYAGTLRDAAARTREAELLVAVEADDALLGTATLILRPGTEFSELATDGDAEMRMLAVDPAAQGRGIGRLLVEHCVERARLAGCARFVLSSRPDMRAAHRVYAAIGFTRAPELDWEPVPGFVLLGYMLGLSVDAAAAYCDHCGRPVADSDHGGCAQRRALEPPRYCARCGRRMVVQVTPRGWNARCVEHGTTTG